MASVRSLAADPDFQALSPEARGLVVDRMGADDPEFVALSPDAQAVVRQRITTATGGPGPLAGPRSAAPAGLPSRVQEGMVRAALRQLGNLVAGRGLRPPPREGLAPAESTWIQQQQSRGMAPAEIGAELGGVQAPTMDLPLVMDPTEALVGAGTMGAATRSVGQALRGAAAFQTAGISEIPSVARGVTGFARGVKQGMREVPAPFVPEAGATAPAADLSAGAQRVEAAMAAPPGLSAAAQTAAPAGTIPTPLKTAAEVAASAERIPGELGTTLLKEGTSRRVVQAAEEVFAAGKVPFDPDVPAALQVSRAVAEGRVPLGDLQPVLEKHGLSLTDFAQDVLLPKASDAGRTLQQYSEFTQTLRRAAGNVPGAAEALRAMEAAGKDAGASALPWWRRLDNIRRGLLVSQFATAMRNAGTQVGRVGLDVMQGALDAGLQRLTGTAGKTDPLGAFETVLNLFSKTGRNQTDTILRAFPKQQDVLFSRYASDVATQAREGGVVLKGADRAFATAEAGVDLLNTANRFQEFLLRRAAFPAKLGQILKAQGQDLGEILAQNRVGAIPVKAIEQAVEQTLELTFAATPKSDIARTFIDAVNKIPGATLAIPFPRFLMNSLKFFTDFSPLGMLRLLGPAERAAFAAGDTKTISRALLGTAMLGAAYEFRGSEYAGEKWYEAKLPDGRTVDLRAYNPFAAYLFVGDVARRMKDGTLYRLEAKDVAMGVLSANIRAGTGLFIMDQMLKGLTDLGDPEKQTRAVKALAGETVAGFLTPLQQAVDLMAEYDDRLAVVRDRRDEPFLGPLKAKIPGLAQQLPPAFSPTREGPMLRESPALRQATGITLGPPKNALERELDRLQFNRQEILPSTGEPAADRLLAMHMGVNATQILPFLESPQYQQLPDGTKGEVLRRVLGGLRQRATQQAMAADPQTFARLRLDRLPLRQRALLREYGLGVR